jgi:hypothetical protein
MDRGTVAAFKLCRDPGEPKQTGKLTWFALVLYVVGVLVLGWLMAVAV